MNLLTLNLDTVSHGVRTGSKPESKTCYCIYIKPCCIVDNAPI